jgi:hypothetical protein
MAAIANAIREMISALHERTSGHRFFRRSASHTHSQWHGEPGVQPPVACASCAQESFRNSLGYPAGIDGVGEVMLAAYEKEGQAYRAAMSCDGLLPEALVRRDLTAHAYLVCFAVPELVAEIRRLRTNNDS